MHIVQEKAGKPVNGRVGDCGIGAEQVRFQAVHFKFFQEGTDVVLILQAVEKVQREAKLLIGEQRKGSAAISCRNIIIHVRQFPAGSKDGDLSIIQDTHAVNVEQNVIDSLEWNIVVVSLTDQAQTVSPQIHRQRFTIAFR